MGFSRQEYWSGLPFPSLGDLPNPGIKPTSPVFPAFAGGFFTTEPPRLLLGVKDRNSTQSSLGPRGICWEGCVSHRLAAWAPGVMGTRDYFYLSAPPPLLGTFSLTAHWLPLNMAASITFHQQRGTASLILIPAEKFPRSPLIGPAQASQQWPRSRVYDAYLPSHVVGVENRCSPQKVGC